MARLGALEEELLRIGSAYTGKWTYALTDLASGESIAHRPDDVMPTASLIKVPVLVALYRAVGEGRVNLTDCVRYGDEHRCLGSGVLSRMTPGVEMTVRDAAVLMIIISDNSATNMCIDLVGLAQVNETMRGFGLEQTTIFQRLGDTGAGLHARKMSVSTARELTRLLDLIARHEAISPEASEDMLRIMRRQDYRHELSRLLPWNEMNMLEDHKVNWMAEKGGSFLKGHPHLGRRLQRPGRQLRDVGLLRGRHWPGHRTRVRGQSRDRRAWVRSLEGAGGGLAPPAHYSLLTTHFSLLTTHYSRQLTDSSNPWVTNALASAETPVLRA